MELLVLGNVVISPKPVACPVCKRASMILVNQGGAVTCAVCAPKK